MVMFLAGAKVEVQCTGKLYQKWDERGTKLEYESTRGGVRDKWSGGHGEGKRTSRGVRGRSRIKQGVVNKEWGALGLLVFFAAAGIGEYKHIQNATQNYNGNYSFIH